MVLEFDEKIVEAYKEPGLPLEVFPVDILLLLCCRLAARSFLSL
jgi:hypothetical protein